MPLVRTALSNPSKVPKGKGEKRQERGAVAVAVAVVGAGDWRVEREGYRGFSTQFSVLGFMSPPSSSGISRLSPAPEVPEPSIICAGELERTVSSAPDSLAGVGCSMLA